MALPATREDSVVADIVLAGTNRWLSRKSYHPKAPAEWLMTYTTGGRGRCGFGTTWLTPTSGDLVLVHRDQLLRPDLPYEHSVPDGEWRYHYVCFNSRSGWDPPAPFAAIAPTLHHARVELAHTQLRLEDAFRRLIADLRARQGEQMLAGLRVGDAQAQPVADSRRELTLTALREILLLVRVDVLDTAQLDPRILDALRVITGDLSTRHDLGLLARAAGLSTSRFVHLFRDQLGVPPRHAIRALRLQQAALRLAYGHEPVGAIAVSVGFSSLFDLSRAFRQVYGVSPSAYRRGFQVSRSTMS